MARPDPHRPSRALVEAFLRGLVQLGDDEPWETVIQAILIGKPGKGRGLVAKALASGGGLRTIRHDGESLLDRRHG